MPGVYFHKLLDFFPTSTAMSLDSHSWCLEFIFINSWTFSQRLPLCPLTVTVDAWSLFSSTAGLFANVYCYVPWQSQLMPGVYFHKLPEFFPKSTAMSLDSHSWWLEFYFHKLSEFFPTSTAMSLDSHSWSLEFIFINSWTFSQRLMLCPLTATVEAWSLFS